METNFQCGICAKLFSSEAEIDLHILNDHNEKDEDSMAHFNIMEETNREGCNNFTAFNQNKT